MRIVSSYKDYYDYIAQHYGFDPDVLYLRRPIDIQKIPFHLKTLLESRNQHPRILTRISSRRPRGLI
jgi:hypothetical protein